MKKTVFILGLFCATAARAACPDGYTSVTGGGSIDDCYMEIAPGYYWTGSAVELCPAGHACAGGNMPYADRGDAWGIVVCSGSDSLTAPTTYLGMSYCGCPIDPLDGQRGIYIISVISNANRWCYKHANVSTYLGVNEYTTGYANCYWNGTNYSVGGINIYGCDKYNIIACAAGYYAPTTYKYTLINCIPVEAGYYSPEGATERTACPDGLTTAGYGAAADEVADCGHALHIGDQTLHLRSEKRTTPALHVRVGNQTFYGDMTTVPKGKIRIKIGDTVYSVFDDNM